MRPAPRPAVPPPDVETLYRRHRDELYRYLVRWCGSPILAEDAIQEAFRALLAASPREENLRAWLFRVAMNAVRDKTRRRERRERLLRRSGDALRPAADPGPEEEIERRAAARRVRDALDRLPERDRTVLLMREEGFSHAEIADMVGVRASSVGTVAARALAKLGNLLDPGSGAEEADR